MAVDFCPGYGREPFATLVREYPDSEVYPSNAFRAEWGPLFHRGRLDGTARFLLIGQDPAAHENIARRILVGVAGKRAQGFMAKLGFERSYVIINTFLYSVLSQSGGAAHVGDPALVAYRNRWIASILETSRIEAVVAMGALADKAWKAWCATPAGAASKALPYRPVPHPTSPDSAAAGNPDVLAKKTKAMLQAYNRALQALHPAVENPDVQRPLVLYGEAFTAAELPDIPAADLPGGLPAWMRGSAPWAARSGADAKTKRRTITVTVPPGVIA